MASPSHERELLRYRRNGLSRRGRTFFHLSNSKNPTACGIGHVHPVFGDVAHDILDLGAVAHFGETGLKRFDPRVGSYAGGNV